MHAIASPSGKSAQRVKTRIRTPRGSYITAERVVAGVAINPRLPVDFDQTPNDDRPDSHAKFWHVPYIVTETLEYLDAYYAGRTDQWAEEGRTWWATKGRPNWLEAWPTGTRYTVRCLDGGAWDRSTNWGSYGTLEAALAVAGGTA